MIEIVTGTGNETEIETEIVLATMTVTTETENVTEESVIGLALLDATIETEMVAVTGLVLMIGVQGATPEMIWPCLCAIERENAEVEALLRAEEETTKTERMTDTNSNLSVPEDASSERARPRNRTMRLSSS
jgi:hypothetical protein